MPATRTGKKKKKQEHRSTVVSERLCARAQLGREAGREWATNTASMRELALLADSEKWSLVQARWTIAGIPFELDPQYRLGLILGIREVYREFCTAE